MIERHLQNIFRIYAPKWFIMVFDLIIVSFAFIAAYIIRFNFKLDFDIGVMFKQMPFVFFAGFISFICVGSYKGVVRFTGFKDVINIIIGVNILATILIISTYFSRKLNYDGVFNMSGSIIYIHLLLNILFLVGIKLFIKSIYNKLIEDFDTQKKILIFGAGSSGMITYEAISNDPTNSHKIVGFIDDNKDKIGKYINTLRVYSLEEITPTLIKKNGIEEVIISIQNIEPSRLLQMSGTLFELGLKVKIVPPVKQWIEGDLSIGQIKEVNIEDLLGRDPISITNPKLFSEYDNKIIFVTGAAGSIGSEIARKIVGYNYTKLILIDSAESALYNLQQEFHRKNISKFEAIVSDIRDAKRMENLFSKYKPDIVFHAAAYKHVPLMEKNPYEAINVNVQGTKNIVNLSIEHSVHKFVLISTDKAVNPTNVMGATKRIAELYINSQAGQGVTKFVTTRFGNVLGSSGSVIPLFKKQIETGGPITVTHKDITRYFMTIPEACQLVLEAAAMGRGGEIFVFDMGESIKIFDLARNMIILSGLRYPEDINIEIIGLRPGEKIYEELLADGENTSKTYHEKIMIAKTVPLNKSEIYKKITELCQINAKVQNIQAIALLKQIVPEYVSNNSEFEILDD